MALLRKLNPKRLLVRLLTRLLVQEHRGYRARFPNDMALLRQTLRPGDVVHGPAIIEQEDSTTVVWDGQTSTVDAYSNLIVERTA